LRRIFLRGEQFVGVKQTHLPPILCVGFPSWEGEYQKSTVQLMRALARQHRVLYVEYPFTWKDVWRGMRGGPMPWRRMLGLAPRLRPFSSGGPGQLHVLTLPPVLPVNGLDAGLGYEMMARTNAAVAAQSIKRSLKWLGYGQPIMINAFNPFLGAYLSERLEVQGSYYYCYDEIGAARWTHRHGPRLEKRLLAQVDGLLASSAPLLEAKGSLMLPDQRLLLKNGANVGLFEQAFRPQPNRDRAPSLGYLGSIDDRTDVDLLLTLLAKWPEARLLMVGRITDAEVGERLAAHERVELAGAQSPQALPQWVERMDVGLIPFVKNEFTRYIYPLKINEYLAAGLPVVSTHFGDLGDFHEVARIVEQGHFAAACQEAWDQDSAAQRKMRRAFAREQSWEGRAAELAAWLHERRQVRSLTYMNGQGYKGIRV
jgi:glycosyltransferase involved in cell wall biosynthesis